MYTDTHAHVHSLPLVQEIDSLIERARKDGVGRIVTIGTKLGDSGQAVKIANKYNGMYATVGVHPHYADDFSFKDLSAFETLITENKKVLAVGEVGLDFFRNRSIREKQIEVFRIMIDMSVAAGLPVMIHAREAATDVVEQLNAVLGDNKTHPVIFHCFSGEQSLVDWGLKRDRCMFSFAGNVTYPKAVQLHNALKQLPLERLFIETDCPYLTPEPNRGQQNEPSYIHFTAKFVAKQKRVELNALQEQLEKNFISFFGNHPAGL